MKPLITLTQDFCMETLDLKITLRATINGVKHVRLIQVPYCPDIHPTAMDIASEFERDLEIYYTMPAI